MTMRGNKNRGLNAAIAAILSLAGPPAPLAASSPESGVTSALEEIVVSARRREERLQDTPVSIAAFTADALATRQVTNIAEAGQFVPNVSFDGAAPISGASNATTLFIRGIGQTDFNLTIDPGVGVYLDGVYVSRSIGGLLDTADLERLEILRGPQGTLFGKNTIGGALLLTSKAPADAFGARLQVTTGRFDRLDLQGMANVPVSDRVLVRASANIQSRDGYLTRLSDKATQGDRDSQTGRLQTRFEPSDAFDLTVSVDGTRQREHAPAVKTFAIYESALFAAVHNLNIGGNCIGPPDVPPDPARLDNPQCYNAQWLTPDLDTSNSSDRNVSDTDVWGAAITANWRFAGLALKSISAYRDLQSHFYLETDGAPLTVSNTGNDYSQDQLSQELQLSGSWGDSVRWLAGAYYMKERGRDRNYLVWSIGAGQSGGQVDNESRAAFGQLVWRLGQAASLTLGGRYSEERKGFLPDQYLTEMNPIAQAILTSVGIVDLQGGPLDAGDRLLPQVHATAVSHEFTPSIAFDYRLAPDVLAYVSYAKGFKAGGFTQRVFPPLAEVPAFAPEFVDSYEIGLKSEWLERRLRMNAAAFYMDYTDLQITVTKFVAPTIQNAGKARSRGVELDLEAALTGTLRINAGVGFTDAAYREVPANAAPVTVDSKLPNAPRWTGTLGLSADLFSTKLGTASLRIDAAYRGEHFKDAPNTPELRQGGYTTVNAAVSFETDDARWKVNAGVANATDERYLLTGNADITGGGYIYGIFSRPREWFASLTYQY